MIRARIDVRLTIGWQVALAISCQEVVALPLTLELSSKDFRGYLRIGDMAMVNMLHVLVDLIH